MAESTRFVLYLVLSLLLLFNFLSLKFSSANDAHDLDDDEDVAFLSSLEPDTHSAASADYENYDDLEDGSPSDGGGEDSDAWPKIDETDVVVLTKDNFTEFIGKNSYVMVEFYAPWCGHCQALAPEYAEAATELKGVAALAKVDGTEEGELAQNYEVQGFPTVILFVDGVMHKAYDGQRNKDAIVAWLKKRTGPSIANITTIEEAEHILETESKVVLGFLNSLVGPESEEFAAASRLDDDVSFYQTTNLEVAKLFHIEPQAKLPALVLLKKEDEKLSHFDGALSKSAIAEFVAANKAPLVINFTRESAPLVFENPIKNQIILFTSSNDSEKFVPLLRETAKAYKGKFVFVHVEMDNDDYGQSVSNFFGISGVAPQVLAYTGNDDAKKFILDGELTLSSIKSFAEDFLADKLKLFFKSDPIPEKNDGDIKIIVGNNLDEIVLDESKDVLLEIYAPWCGYCQSFEPTYEKLAKYLRGIDSLVIAKMDGTTNEHPRAKPDGFPTILFFPAGNKSFDPITIDTDRTVVALYKFLKKHASIPFKLQKPASTKDSKAADNTIENKRSDDGNVKDEL